MKTVRDEFLEMTYNKDQRKMLVCLTPNLHGNGLVMDKTSRYKISFDQYMLEYRSLLLENYLIDDGHMIIITEKGRRLVHRGGFSPSLMKRAINAMTTNATTIISIVALLISILSYLKDRIV